MPQSILMYFFEKLWRKGFRGRLLPESVKCRFGKRRFSAELGKLEKYSDGGQRRKINPKSLGLSAAVRE